MMFAMKHVFLMSQDSLSDPSKSPQIPDISDISASARDLASIPEPGHSSLTFSETCLCHTLFFTSFLEPPLKKTTGNINLIPMVWKDLTYAFGSATNHMSLPTNHVTNHCDFSKKNLQTSNFKYAKLWFLSRCNLVVFFQVQFSIKSLRCKSVVSTSLQSSFLLVCSIAC